MISNKHVLRCSLALTPHGGLIDNMIYLNEKGKQLPPKGERQMGSAGWKEEYTHAVPGELNEYEV